MSWIGISAAVMIGLFLSGFFSGAETGLYRANRLRIRLGVHRRDPRAMRLAGLLEDEQGTLSVALIGTNVANYVTTLAVTYFFASLLGLSDTRAEIYTIAAVTPVIFVFGEMVPKTLFQLHPDRLLRAGSRLLAISNRLFRMTGIVWFLARLAGAINRLAGLRATPGTSFDPKRRVAVLLQEALARDTLSQDQSELIDQVCQLSETPIHSVMVPRNRVRLIAADADRRELLRAARKTGHARLPVYATSARHITGVIKVDELLRSDGWNNVGQRLQPPLTLGPHTNAATAITQMRQARRGMAVVIDRSGHLLGIVTLKDLLREIVGEVAAGV